MKETSTVVRCKLTLLGGFSLETADGAKLTLPTRKDRLLLAYLALSGGRPQPRGRLAGLLWGDRPEAQARDSLKQSLAGIRQAFRQAGLDPLRADRESVTLDSADIAIDASEFARMAGRATSAETAIAIYRGELLEGIDGASSEFEAWLLPERERLSDLAVRILELLAQAPGPHSDEALRVGRRLLARDRVREPVYRALMRAHVHRGERAEALKLYTACREALKQELAAAPDAKTEELYRDILTDRLSAPPPAPEIERTTTRLLIAVLPFGNLSDDTVLGHLRDGITEDIITGLGRFRQFFVIDRHSSAAVSQQTSEVADIGRRLGVGYLVQGSLKRLGECIRVTVRLVDAGSRAQIWGDAYDCPMAEILAVPDKVTGAIVSTLQGRVEDSLLEQARRKPTLAAYECVLRGVKHLRAYGPDDNRRAVELFRRAMDLDPDYALARAYLALAEMNVLVDRYADIPDSAWVRVVALAASAIELDAGDSRCHSFLGSIHRYHGDLQSAEHHCRRAIALNPNDADAVARFGALLAALGHPEEGIDRIREAMRLNPYHPEWYWHHLGHAFYVARRYADSAEAFGRVTQPGFWTLSFLAASLAQMGLMDKAAAVVAEVRRRRPDFPFANLRLPEWKRADAEHMIDGMRKAGLLE
jgi:TolB-like protein